MLTLHKMPNDIIVVRGGARRVQEHPHGLNNK